ncbi:Tim44 domain-containing protein [Rhodoferax sp.]|uniref:Tim44 domain-containing protein n=1 Tax=Rhodoferax sp. TaxID=50421 RepID=UPI002606FB3B|nr:Tim44-like domain-containing protein [Rhodoferax sp.]MDD2924235.1 Tim44-like domain-containing protein [Rhodoferax sp.]
MKRWLWVVAMSLALMAGHADAAKRLGGGLSMGKQSSNVTQRQAAPAAPTQAGTATATKNPTPAATPAAAAPKKPWGAMLGGLAAGLGLAWLAHSLGLGEAMGQFMMFALLALVIMVAVGWFMRSRKTQGGAQPASPFAFQGAGPAGQPVAPASYRPENVGNDASARPWERTATAFDSSNAAGGSMIGSGLLGAQTWGIPAGFDTDGFLRSAKANFVSLQAAWDKSDIAALRVMMTDGMLKEIQAQLAEREVHTGGPVNMTDVVMIEAHLLGIEDLGEDYMASVEFSGMIREEPSAGPSPFREVWNMTKPKNGQSGWLVAGVQALQ